MNDDDANPATRSVGETRDRTKAYAAMQRAVNSDHALPRAAELICIDCGKQAEHYHHHQGYSQEHALDVVPLCVRCHMARHPNRVARKRPMCVPDTIMPAILAAMRDQHVSQSELSRRVGTSPSAICNIMAGNRRPTLGLFQRMLDELDLEVARESSDPTDALQ